MATPKKKHLIELMIEAGVKWPEGAEYAAQDKYDLNVNFYKNGKPDLQSCNLQWMANDCTFMSDYGIELDSLCRNWHQTIVTREQYALADAKSWDACMDTSHLEAKSNQVRESENMTPATQQETQPAPEYCASVMRQMPDNTIEQLTADYHAKAAEADRLQTVADEARKAADDALLTLQKAGELIGLVISIDTKPKAVEQLEITDWRDLQVGDVIECVGNWEGENTDGNTYHVTGLDPVSSNSSMPIQIQVPCVECPETWGGEFKFIRRP